MMHNKTFFKRRTPFHQTSQIVFLAAVLLCLCSMRADAATLTGSFASLTGASIDLTTEGKLDWGHWGLNSEGTYNHKYGVAPQIKYSYVVDQFLADGPYRLT